MIKFKQRISPPTDKDMWWIATSKGGLNSCKVETAKTGSVLPSAVGYVFGRYSEILNQTCSLSCATAGQLYLHTEDGYNRGTDPQLGAVMCWSGSTDNGHVAIVEAIAKNGDVTTSEYYKGSWARKTRSPGQYKLAGEESRTFQGFIYNSMLKGTTDKASDFIETAISQIGKNSSWSIKTSQLQSSSWSTLFIVACARQAGILDKLVYKSPSASTLLEMSVGLKMGRWFPGPHSGRTAQPQQCDIVAFRYQSLKSDNGFTADKLGIVTEITDRQFRCVCGDVRGRVAYVDTLLDNDSILGFFRPNWISEESNVLNLIDYDTWSQYKIDGTREDCAVKEVGYMNGNYKPSISSSELKLCCVNYTDLLWDEYDAIKNVLESYKDAASTPVQDSGIPTVETSLDLLNFDIDYTGKVGHASTAHAPGPNQVRIDNWYGNASSNKMVFRYPDSAIASKMARACIEICNNNNVLYSQEYRNTLYRKGREVNFDASKITTTCYTDCSAFMNYCMVVAGVPGISYLDNGMTTKNIKDRVTGIFQIFTDPKYTGSPDYLLPGDIILKGGHVVMNLGIGKMVKDTPGFIEGTTNAMSYDNLSGVAGNAQMVIDYCMKKGLTRAAGCGVAANIQAESGFRTNAVGDHNTSFGLCQWHNKRGTAMMQFCESLGVKWNESFTGQMDYLWSELTSSYKGVYNVLANASDTLAGAITCCNKWIYSYEVPQGYKDPDSDVYKKRQQYTRDIYNGG